MSKDDKNKNEGSSYMLPIIVGLLIIASFLEPYFIKGIALFHRHQHHLYICLVTSLVFAAFLFLFWAYNATANLLERSQNEVKEDSRILIGCEFGTKQSIYIETLARLYHTQVIGSTGTGKSEGIIFPWIVDDIKKGRGLVIIDGKPEKKFLERLYGQVSINGRKKDFLLFSLNEPHRSSSFNPFAYGTSQEVTERVFSSFATDSEFYKSVQYSAFITILDLIKYRNEVPMPSLIRELLSNKALLEEYVDQVDDPVLVSELSKITKLSPEKFEERFAGVMAYLDNFTKSGIASLINQDVSEIDFEDVLKSNKIVYFQLPTLLSPTLGSAIGRLAIQTLAAAAGNVQAQGLRNPNELFSLYLDDFNDYMYEEFASVPNKVRSAGIGMVFSHQSLGDLDKVSESFKNIVIQNTNNKILFKINDPDSAEFFARYIGTQKTEKVTERRTTGRFTSQNTGEQSVRETESYLFHPNVIKSELGLGDAIAVITRLNGPRILKRIKCSPIERCPQILPQENYPLKTLMAPPCEAKGESEQRAESLNELKEKNDEENKMEAKNE